MKISVILATYNGERFLPELLDSLKNQTRPADEIIIQDDGSKDRTRAIVREYIEKNALSDTWIFTENEKNLGYAENFKTATFRSTGDIICFCDQDDIWHTDKLEKLEKVLADNEKIEVVCSHFTPFITGETESKLRDVSGEVNDGSIEKIEFTQKNMFLDSLGCAMAFRRTFLEKTKKYWAKDIAHDEYVWKTALCVDGLYWYNESLLDRRHHSDNVSMRKKRDFNKRLLYLKHFLLSYEEMKKCLCEMNVNVNYLQIVEKQIKAAKLRIDVLENKKIMKSVPLFFEYGDTYQVRRTVLVEAYLSVFKRKG